MSTSGLGEEVGKVGVGVRWVRWGSGGLGRFWVDFGSILGLETRPDRENHDFKEGIFRPQGAFYAEIWRFSRFWPFILPSLT